MDPRHGQFAEGLAARPSPLAAGFTLIEALLAVAVFAILAAGTLTNASDGTILHRFADFASATIASTICPHTSRGRSCPIPSI